MKLEVEKIILLHTAAQKNHKLLQYLQNRFSAQLYSDKKLVFLN